MTQPIKVAMLVPGEQGWELQIPAEMVMPGEDTVIRLAGAGLELAERDAADRGIPAEFRLVGEIIEQLRLDGLIVVQPTKMAPWAAVSALAYGLPVLRETPLARMSLKPETTGGETELRLERLPLQFPGPTGLTIRYLDVKGRSRS